MTISDEVIHEIDEREKESLREQITELKKQCRKLDNERRKLIDLYDVVAVMKPGDKIGPKVENALRAYEEWKRSTKTFWS